MSKFNKIIKDIKEVKIQGAENIAKAGIKAFLLKHNKTSIKKLLSTRKTEPMLQRVIKTLEKTKETELKTKAKELIKSIENSHNKIAENGSKIIKNNMKIFTHCHSSTVISILKQAKKRGKKFLVYNTETRPLFQGRLTAKQLAKAGIKVIHTSDLGAENLIKKSDLFLFGADAYLPGGILNKLGTSMFAKLARFYKVPCYSAGSLLKYTKKIGIELRKPSELWDERFKKISIINPAFDLTKKKYIKALICEKGILTYKDFIKEAKREKLF